MREHAHVQRIRGNRLQAIRRRWFHHHPLCVHCQAAGRVKVATELDHIVPLHQGGTDRASNRQGLCHACHLSKSLAEAGKRERQAIGLDGYPSRA
jgi:5-methylcytosine-specific restriction protein A